jgi:DNA-binding transcriptional LysR family regulator
VHAVRDTGQRERKITIGLLAGAVAAAELTEDIVRTYRNQHPGLTVSLRELTFPDQFSAVASGEVDVAIVRPPYDRDELEVEVLFDEPLVLCCSSYHELADAEEIGIGDILDEPMLDMSGAPRVWTDFWHLREFRGGPARTAADPVATLSELQLAVSFGPVVTPVTASAWRIALASSSLSAIPMRDAPRSQVAVATRHRETRADVADFFDCAREISAAHLDRVPGASAPTV